MRELIYREEAIKAVYDKDIGMLTQWDIGRNAGIDYAIKQLEKLPPAQPEQKTATWLIRKWGDDAKCSNCGHTFKDVYDMDNHDRFCRFCGRKMVGVKGERDGD